MIPLQFASNKYSKSWTVISNTKNEEAPPDAQDQLDGWDFDDGIVLETQIAMPLEQSGSMGLCFSLNFILTKRFFVHKSSRVVSYHLNTSKVQELGTLDVSVTELENTYSRTQHAGCGTCLKTIEWLIKGQLTWMVLENIDVGFFVTFIICACNLSIRTCCNKDQSCISSFISLLPHHAFLLFLGGRTYKRQKKEMGKTGYSFIRMACSRRSHTHTRVYEHTHAHYLRAYLRKIESANHQG